MKEFNVITFDFNTKKVVPYNVIPYFVKEYKALKPKLRPKTFIEFREFITLSSRYKFWSRCQYEILVDGFPSSGKVEKIDVHAQVMANIDIVTQLVIDNIK